MPALRVGQPTLSRCASFGPRHLPDLECRGSIDAAGSGEMRGVRRWPSSKTGATLEGQGPFVGRTSLFSGVRQTANVLLGAQKGVNMWSCGKCGETSEDDYEICWSCGTGQDGSPAGEGFHPVVEVDPLADTTVIDDSAAGDGCEKRTVASEAYHRGPLPGRGAGPREVGGVTKILKIYHVGSNIPSYLNLDSVVLTRLEVAAVWKKPAIWRVFTSNPTLDLAVSEDDAIRILEAMGYSDQADD